MKILVVGGGSVTEELLKSLDLRQDQVIVVEKDSEKCTDIGSKYDVLVINKDATDVSVYTNDIVMSELDGILALTDKDEVNVFTLTIGKLYKVPFRLARVKDPKVAELIIRLDLGVPVTSSSVIASFVKSFLSSIRVPRVLADFGDVKLYHITISETDRATNKTISELNLPEDVKILLVFDGNELKVPKPGDRLLNGYQLLVLSETTDIVKIFKG